MVAYHLDGSQVTYRVLLEFITRVNGSYNDGGTTLTNLIWADSDNGSTGRLQRFSRGSIPRRSTKFMDVIVGTNGHKLFAHDMFRA
jgi:hypothetical protein